MTGRRILSQHHINSTVQTAFPHKPSNNAFKEGNGCVVDGRFWIQRRIQCCFATERRNMIYGERLWMARWRKVEEGILKLEARTDEQRRRDGLIWGTNQWESLLGINELWNGLRFGSWRWEKVDRGGGLLCVTRGFPADAAEMPDVRGR